MVEELKTNCMRKEELKKWITINTLLRKLIYKQVLSDKIKTFILNIWFSGEESSMKTVTVVVQTLSQNQVIILISVRGSIDKGLSGKGN